MKTSIIALVLIPGVLWAQEASRQDAGSAPPACGAPDAQTLQRQALFSRALIHESRRETAEALKAWRDYLALETDPEKRSVAQKHIHTLTQ